MSDNVLDKVLTRREREIMDLLYAEPNLCVSDVNSRLADGSTYSATRAEVVPRCQDNRPWKRPWPGATTT